MVQILISFPTLSFEASSPTLNERKVDSSGSSAVLTSIARNCRGLVASEKGTEDKHKKQPAC